MGPHGSGSLQYGVFWQKEKYNPGIDIWAGDDEPDGIILKQIKDLNVYFHESGCHYGGFDEGNYFVVSIRESDISVDEGDEPRPVTSLETKSDWASRLAQVCNLLKVSFDLTPMWFLSASVRE